MELMRKCVIGIFVMTFLPLLGCFAPHTGYFGMISYYDEEPADEPLFHEGALYVHRSPLVRYPAKTGYNMGCIAGLPISVPSYMIGCIITPYGEDRLAYFAYPQWFMASLGGTIIGAPCWAAFGWWWPQKAEKKDPTIQPDNVSAKTNTPSSG